MDQQILLPNHDYLLLSSLILMLKLDLRGKIVICEEIFELHAFLFKSEGIYTFLSKLWEIWSFREDDKWGSLISYPVTDFVKSIMFYLLIPVLFY